MATTRGENEPVETREERTVRIARSVIGGNEQAQVRRIILYVTLGVSIALCVAFGLVGMLVALPAFTLLLATDGDL